MGVNRRPLYIQYLLMQAMDKPSEATLVGQGPRPQTVKLAGAEGGLSIAGNVVYSCQQPIYAHTSPDM
ncbi:MAG: hypothetical protein KHW53_03535 [Veillonella sp.]|uniref:hypothetical protein n=1 Tax=Veillonella sp. TaxID=1926307 RepID=UPI00257EC475|nr:hypothetical protein [Veillonella sp.]MBS5755750.1 hypothetical protein [Veillonella sp.]